MRGAHPERALEGLVAENVGARRGETLLAAASGGPDSTALAALLARAAASAGATLVLGHVNHSVREGAWQDEAVVLSLGAALRARVVSVGLAPGPSDEARLREERYGSLVAMARSVGASRVFTAHHAEDQTETVLLALFRGAGPDSLGGMPERRPLAEGVDLCRPLLRVAPSALAAYCAAQHLPFARDPTNEDGTYRRSAIRGVLAELRHSFPALDEAVARSAEIAREDRSGTERAAVRRRLYEELAAAGELRDITFERLDAAARGVESGRPGRHFLKEGVELVIRGRPRPEERPT